IWSALEGLSLLDGLDDPVERGVAEEHVERDDHLLGSDLAGRGLEAPVHHDHVGIRRDPADGRVHHLDVLARKAIAQLGHEKHAAPHPGLAGQDDLPNVASRDRRHPAGTPAGAPGAASTGSSSRTVALRMTVATRSVTMAPTATPARTPKCSPLGVTARYAKMLPGDGVETSPAPVTTNVSTADMPPAIIATIRIGFISTYGK